MTCKNCGNPATAPNKMLTYQDDEGEDYTICQMCEDFDIEYGEATDKQKSYMVHEGYGDWQRAWIENERKAASS